MTRLIAIWCPL